FPVEIITNPFLAFLIFSKNVFFSLFDNCPLITKTSLILLSLFFNILICSILSVRTIIFLFVLYAFFMSLTILSFLSSSDNKHESILEYDVVFSKDVYVKYVNSGF